ncbi:nitric oxide reductase activation protein NorD [Celeribacter neptunius]|uniref:Nitric oxide reductase NorD protein n=1 Tax=Celeribacter neptunius TaxID=588602 RepID=A0A1I3R617_9RHOB|nr:nitric oxide reductase D protein [Celeribacter neptunius]SFJ41778.1 nitric oxide reductase NorD protein [Celeribacter neptunius]
MGKIEFEPWEPEETVGKLWHKLASRFDAPEAYDGARVDLSQIDGRLAVFFRAMGGDPSVEIKPVSDEISHHRLSRLRALGTYAEELPRASFDGGALRLPATLACFPFEDANASAYLWLVAMASQTSAATAHEDPLVSDLQALGSIREALGRSFDEAPGLQSLYRELAELHLSLRDTPELPEAERLVEAVIRHILGDPAPLVPKAHKMLASVERGDVSIWKAPRKYRPFRPVPIWVEPRVGARSTAGAVETQPAEPVPENSEEQDEKTRRARRRRSDQIDRKDSFILHKFEAILSYAQFINLNRRVEDDDEDSAKKAADDQEEIGLGEIKKAPATRLRLHLDLAPEDAEIERLSAQSTYPEWDVKRGVYLPDHTRVLAHAVAPDGTAGAEFDQRARKRIRAVKRQFEALRPSMISTVGHLDGDELDDERAVRAAADFAATGESDARVWRQNRPLKRDLAVSILLDVSRSTEATVTCHQGTGRPVIDIEREALTALAWGLDACGDDFAIHGFSSIKRDRVFIAGAKAFGEPMGSGVEARIAALKPGFYTRLGAAIRHASAGLTEQGRKRRLLLVITDGKPNDLDHYEGRHGIEDSRMAVIEARRAGHAVFGITVDRDGKAWFPRIFGQGGFALVPDPDRLTEALPRIYAQIVGH